jgi:hypothetical protein
MLTLATALGGAMSPFVKGLLVGVIVYWGVQHFTGIGSTGKGSAVG